MWFVSTSWARGRGLLSLKGWLLSLLMNGCGCAKVVVLDCAAFLFAASCVLQMVMAASRVSSYY